jgi:HAE1 family hydrophobic/amphiphilic exporter-1
MSFRFVGTELTPEPDTGDIVITFHLPEGTRIEETDRVVREIIAYCEQNVSEAKYVFGFDGREEEGFTVAVGQEAGPNIGTVGLRLVDKNERDRSAFEIADGIRRWMRNIPRIEKMTVLVSSPIKAMFLGSKPLSVEVYGENLEEVRSVSNLIAEQIDSVQGTVDVAVSQKEPRPEIHVELDREKAALMGVRTASVGAAMRTYFYGYLTDQDYWEGEDNYPIRVRLEESQKDDIEIFSRLLVPSVTGRPVRLSNVATIREDLGPPQIDRKNRQRYITVDANVHGRSLGEVTADVRSLIDQMKIPSGVRIEFGGEVEEQRKAFVQMRYLVLLGILLVYMVMAGQYEAYLDPLVIMFSVPFALTGVAAAYLLTGLYLSLQGVLGIIMLVGIVVNIAIVLVDYINLTRARGAPLRDALIQAGVRRLRPALMTTFTTFFGMSPMAVSRGQGAELWKPLAVSVMGGLVVSMLVTLVLVPVLYSLVEERIRRRPRFVEAREVTEE